MVEYTSLTKITIPFKLMEDLHFHAAQRYCYLSSEIEIHESAFGGCKSLEQITILSSFEEIIHLQ